MAVVPQGLEDSFCRAFEHVKSLILRRSAQESNEIPVCFNNNKARVRSHSTQNLRRDDAHTWTIFHDHARLRPIDWFEEMIDQEP